MDAIKRLPEALRNTVRSGAVLFDLTRVVEELVFNSLDAGARKVSVFAGVGTCHVKVVDDGSGISRDGLVLLGERYATSKLHHLADMDTVSGTFGFRGEALASISDVSLLEVITKAYGRPNGYRKVMKGSKCLFLGIDDDRKDVGTTVVVRDLFYNQPVRRKCMQSSPKKVLHSVKKSVLRIALVHPKISFKVVDIESEVELLRTHSSASPLSVLMSGFGIEDSSFLHELNVDDDIFKISGYLSTPCNTFSKKAFQYVYINSRYICKGPIHKLMNQLAAGFECLDSWKVNSGSRKGKRNRSQAYPAYILNLSCPRSLYDLTFEPSKTYVVFKDWGPVFTFIEKAIQTVWMKNKTYGESFNHTADMVGKDEIRKKGDNIISAGDLSENAEFSQFRFQNHQASLHLPPSSSEELARKDDNLFLGECERNTFQEFKKDTKKLKEENTEMEFYGQADYSFQPLNGSVAESSHRVPRKIDKDLWKSGNHLSLKDGYFFKNRLSDVGRSICVEGDLSSSQLGKHYLEIEPGIRNEPSGSALSFDADDFSNELELCKDIKQPFLQSCSSRGSLPFDGTLFAGEEGFESLTDSFNNKRKRTYVDERVNILEVDDNNQRFNFFPRTLWQDKASYTHHFPRFMAKGDRSTGFDLLSRDSPKSPLSYAEPFTEKTSFLSDSDALVNSDPLSFNSEWFSVTSDPLLRVASRGVGHYTNENALEGSFRLGEEPNYGQLADGEENSKFSYDITLKNTNQDNCTSSCSATGLDFEDYNDFSKDFCKIHWEDNLSKKVTSKHFDTLIDETDWLCTVSCGNNNAGISKFESQRDPFRFPNCGISKFESRRDPFRFQNCEKVPIPKERLRKSHSAPPFRRQKIRFVSLNHCSAIPAGKPNVHSLQNSPPSPEAGALKHIQQTSDVCHLNLKPSPVENLLFGTRVDTKQSNTTVDMKKTQKGGNIKQSQCAQAHHGVRGEDFISKETQDSEDSLTKWRNSCPQTTKNNRSRDIHYQDNILDISSGLLHLAGDSFIPESINKSCLEDAKVLQQVDKKFIAVVAGGTLAVIDQHAADERIRLEELRHKVLSGEAKTMTYLDAEQELVLPEIGYQLLHSYAEQIKDWGWICNIHNQSSKSFEKNLNLLNRQPTIVTLLAVPCILGINLSDVDLLEFLQQLADTDGSSTMPPSVLRVLNSKACRGAIMFGDSLLPSECSLIVEELKQTSLCFQCAHGRPTTVPLVNLEALHKQIAQLGVLNNHTSEVWHGFRRHEPSLERARARLSAAKG